MTTERGLVRSEQDRMIGGVIGGLAERFDMDATLLRVVYVVGSALSAAFPGILVYLLLWVAMPAERTYS